MKDEETLKSLINELIEIIQGSIQDSKEVNRVLREIEKQGFSLNLSMLIGIFVRDRDGMDMFFSSMGGEDTQRLLKDLTSAHLEDMQELDGGDSGEEIPDNQTVPEQGEWTESDSLYLDSLGLRFES
jgi:hypothetical protein